MEQIINTRIVWYLKKKRLLLPHQAGFRKHMSTEDQVVHVAQEMEDAFREGRHTVAVWMDMKKKIGQGMTQRPETEKAQSRCPTRRSSLPYPVFDFHKWCNIRRGVNSSLYADDLAMWTSERHISTASTKIQNALRSLESWSSNWLLKINEGKTMYNSFTLSNRKQEAKLLLNRQNSVGRRDPHLSRDHARSAHDLGTTYKQSPGTGETASSNHEEISGNFMVRRHKSSEKK
jgi:hypothetical protein